MVFSVFVSQIRPSVRGYVPDVWSKTIKLLGECLSVWSCEGVNGVATSIIIIMYLSHRTENLYTRCIKIKV